MNGLEPGEDFLSARMPVDHRTRQPYGFLHGGASVALAETLGSVAAAMVIDSNKFYCVGLEINANHVRSARDGYVTGIAKPIHIGASTQVWDVKIYDEKEKLVCVSRITVAIFKIKLYQQQYIGSSAYVVFSIQTTVSCQLLGSAPAAFKTSLIEGRVLLINAGNWFFITHCIAVMSSSVCGTSACVSLMVISYQ